MRRYATNHPSQCRRNKRHIEFFHFLIPRPRFVSLRKNRAYPRSVVLLDSQTRIERQNKTSLSSPCRGRRNSHGRNTKRGSAFALSLQGVVYQKFPTFLQATALQRKLSFGALDFSPSRHSPALAERHYYTTKPLMMERQNLKKSGRSGSIAKMKLQCGRNHSRGS